MADVQGLEQMQADFAFDGLYLDEIACASEPATCRPRARSLEADPSRLAAGTTA